MKPQISINENNVRILTDQFDLNLTIGTSHLITEKVTPVIQAEIPSEQEAPRRIINGNSISYKLKICSTCGKEFKPNGNRQTKCSVECGLKPKSVKEKIKLRKDLSEKEKLELEKTLAEIEEKKKQPYKIGE